jgi:hypothetical protein
MNLKIRPAGRRAAAVREPLAEVPRFAVRARPAGARGARDVRWPRRASKLRRLLLAALGLSLTVALVVHTARAASLKTVPTPSARGEKATPGKSQALQAADTVRLLDLLSRAGRAFSGRRFDSAARLYRQASALDPADGQPLVMAGVAAYQANAPTIARRDLRLAMRRRLLPEDRELALTYLGLIAQDLRPAASASLKPGSDAGSSLSLATSLGGGYDSNARQARRGVLDTEDATLGPASGSMFASAGIEIGLDAVLAERIDIELGLSVEQSFYPDRSVADLDFQEYGLRLQVGHRLLDVLTARLVVSSDLSFSGLGAALRPFQSSVRLEPQLVFGDGSARLRLTGAWQSTTTHDATLGYLSGRRLEATITPTFSIGGWPAALGARVRHNALGTDRTPLGPGEEPGCAACTSTRIVPYSHGSVGGVFSLSGPYGWRVRPSVAARWEIRVYDDLQLVEQTGALPALQREARFRRDEQLAVASGIALRLKPGYILNLRYERSGFSSTLTPVAGSAAVELAAESRRFRKNTLALDLTVDWL